MKINQKIIDALNRQIQEEFYSAYLYLAMSADCEVKDLGGFAHWLKLQYHEELEHAERIYAYIHDRGGVVKLEQIDQPRQSWESPQVLFEAALSHEQHITKCIYDLVELSQAQKDHATYSFLQWFVNEQVEEEKTVRDITQSIKLVEQSPGGLYMINRELGQRSAAGHGH